MVENFVHAGQNFKGHTIHVVIYGTRFDLSVALVDKFVHFGCCKDKTELVELIREIITYLSSTGKSTSSP